jgi:hypothetical protein
MDLDALHALREDLQALARSIAGSAGGWVIGRRGRARPGRRGAAG